MADEIRKVAGYRGLNLAETRFLSRIRNKAADIATLIADMRAVVVSDDAGVAQINRRWVSVAEKQFKVAAQSLERAITNPAQF